VRRGLGPLTIEPAVDVTFPESPLASDTDSRDLSSLDQAVDRSQIDLEVLEDLFGRQKDFVVLKIERQSS
jgi:hypothetical protein